MLKDRYPQKLSIQEANLLFDTISHTFQNYGNTKVVQLQLPLAVIEPFYKRLSGALLLPNGKVRISLRKTEALAFHTLYMANIITSNFVTEPINTTIHKTL